MGHYLLSNDKSGKNVKVIKCMSDGENSVGACMMQIENLQSVKIARSFKNNIVCENK